MGYITPNDVRNFIRNDEYTDDQIQAIIDRVSGVVDEKIEHTAGSPKTITRYFDGNGTKELVVVPGPIVSLSSVEKYNEYSWEAYDVSAIDIVDGNKIVLRYSSTHPDSIFPEGINNIKITYTFGYTAVPAWIKDYVLLRVADELMPGDYTEALKRAEEAFNSARII